MEFLFDDAMDQYPGWLYKIILINSKNIKAVEINKTYN